MLQFFFKLKSSYETDFGQDLVLFNNKEILVDQKTFFYKSWFKKEFSGYTTSSQGMAHFFRTVNLLTSLN